MGGIGPGECVVIVGSSGQGKSIIKNNLAYMASLQVQNRWIAHVTLELSELDNHLRYAARILGVSQDDVVRNTEAFKAAITQLRQGRRIYVKWFPPMNTTPSTIRSWISSLSAEIGMSPGALVVDYPDKLSPSQGVIDNLYVDIGRVYSELIILLHDYQMPGFFSSQLDRANQYSNMARSSSIANSIAKLYDADVVGTINQSETDKQNGVGRIWWDKCRRGRDMFHTYFRIDYSKAYVYEDIEASGAVQGGFHSRGTVST
jgi:replicative DNA helicase